MADRLLMLVPENATVARLGGDEFLVLLPEKDLPRRIARRILSSFQSRWSLGGHEVRITARIGAAVASIVQAIVAMAESLNLWAIAEGVGEAAELVCLEALSCEEYQGFLFSRPDAPEVNETMLEQERSNTPQAGSDRVA